MSPSNRWTEYHLTPRGWVQGRTRNDDEITQDTPPSDRVLTVCVGSYVGSVERTTVLWQSDDTGQIQTLLTKYGSVCRSSSGTKSQTVR